MTTLLQGLQKIIPVGASETIIPEKEIIGWLALLEQASQLMWQLHCVSFLSEKSAPVIKACLAAAQALYEPDKPYSITIPKSCGATLTTLLIQTTTVHEQMRAVLDSSSADITTQTSSDAAAASSSSGASGAATVMAPKSMSATSDNNSSRSHTTTHTSIGETIPVAAA